jgi:predicted nucleotidyltransferase
MRIAEADALMTAVADWAEKRDDIRAMAVVGSWARGRPRSTSDLDLLLLTSRASDYRRRRKWLAGIDFRKAGFRLRSSEGASYGAVWSLHVHLRPIADVELTFAECAWANTNPIDAGTRSVVTGGFRIIFDQDGLLAKLVDAVPAMDRDDQASCL